VGAEGVSGAFEEVFAAQDATVKSIAPSKSNDRIFFIKITFLSRLAAFLKRRCAFCQNKGFPQPAKKLSTGCLSHKCWIFGRFFGVVNILHRLFHKNGPRMCLFCERMRIFQSDGKLSFFGTFSRNNPLKSTSKPPF
jgi:hypothetical protein